MARVRTNRGATETHGFGLVEDRDAVRCRIGITASALTAVVGDNVEVSSGHRAVSLEATLDPALEALACTADGCFFVACHAHHYRAVDLLRHLRRDRHAWNAVSAGALTEAAACRFVNKDEVFLWYTHDARHAVG